MSKVHVLTSDMSGNYHIVIHTPTPSGNNSAGVSWKTAGLNSGLMGITTLTEGTGAGQITTSERTTIISGDIIEIVTTIPAESGGASSQSLDQMINQIINQTLSDLEKKLKYFGYIQN